MYMCMYVCVLNCMLSKFVCKCEHMYGNITPLLYRKQLSDVYIAMAGVNPAGGTYDGKLFDIIPMYKHVRMPVYMYVLACVCISAVNPGIFIYKGQ